MQKQIHRPHPIKILGPVVSAKRHHLTLLLYANVTRRIVGSFLKNIKRVLRYVWFVNIQRSIKEKGLHEAIERARKENPFPRHQNC